jgi:hypothetical protein
MQYAQLSQKVRWARCLSMTRKEWTSFHQPRANTRWGYTGCSCNRAASTVFSKIVDSKRRESGTLSAMKHDSSHMDSLDAFHSQKCSRAASGIVFQFSVREMPSP